MLDFDTAQQRLALVAARPDPHRTELCALRHAAGRVLATPFVAAIDSPQHDNSAMDGYAIRYADYRGPEVRFPVQQRCYAGQAPEPLQPGQATRLFTGSLIPAGADTVVMQEDCEEIDGAVHIRQAPVQGAHIRQRAADMARGATLLPAGTLLGAAQIATLAAQGTAQVQVYPRLKIGILTTGDELVPPGMPLTASQTYNANGFMLAALLEGMGAVVPQMIHAADRQDDLESAFGRLVQDCDLVLSIGGVSVGEKDLVKPAIASLGGKLDWWRVNMKPGKPVALADLCGKPLVCLPGNPVSSFVVTTLLVSPLVRALQGRAHLFPTVYTGIAKHDIVNLEKRTEFVRVRAQQSDQHAHLLTAYPQQGSGIISSLPWASGLARIPAQTTVTAGSPLDYYPLSLWTG